MEYSVDFALFSETQTEIPEEVRDRLVDGWIALVEKEELYTAGGVREFTKVDAVTEHLALTLWKYLWKVKWLRVAV